MAITQQAFKVAMRHASTPNVHYEQIAPDSYYVYTPTSGIVYTVSFADVVRILIHDWSVVHGFKAQSAMYGPGHYHYSQNGYLVQG